MTILYLVRHGETVDNKKQILQGQTQGELTPIGVEQAKTVRDKMASTHIDAFMSSDLKRSMDTCNIIAEPHSAPIIYTPLLRERDWGGFTGIYIPDIKDVTWPNDIEPLEQMKERARMFIQHVKANFPNKTILAVGHGIINKVIQSIYYEKSMNEIDKMENAEVRILKL